MGGGGTRGPGARFRPWLVESWRERDKDDESLFHAVPYRMCLSFTT